MAQWTPHEYQKKAISFMIQNGSAGLLLDPGLGKTSISFAAFKLLKAQGLVDKMLVIAPLRPCHVVWPYEATKWENFKDLRVVVLHGPEKDARLESDADVYVINPEGLRWLVSKNLSWWWDMLVVDESTQFKHTDTRRFKIIKPLLPKFKRRYILTGSPAPNGLLDLFGQIYLLDLGNALGRYITWYRSAYFVPDYTGFKWTPQATAAERIYAKLQPLVLRMSALDYLELPELVYNYINVELPPDAKKLYDDMEAYLVASMKDGVVTAANVASATGKCRQIANGGVYYEGDKAAVIHKEKLDAVEELVEELSGKPALVAYEYEHDLERLRTRFPEAPHIGGGVPAARFRDIERAWNAGEIPVLLAQPQSVAHGLNLQGTSAAVIWHSLTWNLESYEQFIRRVWRQGQRERVVVHHVVATDTIDEVIVKTLAMKDKTQQNLLTALKERLRIEAPKEAA